MVVERPTINLAVLEILRPSTGFVIGRSVLGRTVLAASSGALQWQSLMGQATHISIARGSRSEGVVETAQVGTMTVSLVNENMAISATDIKPNQQIRLRMANSAGTAFTGKVLDVSTSTDYNRNTNTFTDFMTITAVDAVQELANITRYGALIEPQTLSQRLASLLSSWPGNTPFTPDSSDTAYRLGGTVYEGSLAAHLDLACNSVGAHWWITTAGQFNAARVVDGNSYGVACRFTDFKADVNGSTAGLHYTNIETSYDTKNMVNDLTLNQHDTQVNDSGETVADDNSFNYKSAQSIADFGSRAGSLDVSLYSATDLNNRAAELFANYSQPQFRVTRMEWNVQEDSTFVPNLDVNRLIEVDYRRTTDVYRIVNITHEITPQRWIATYELSKDR